MENIFKNICKGKIVVVGIGNPLRGDDGLGPALIAQLKSKRKEMVCFDVGSSPESYARAIIKEKPDTILIVDAVHMDCDAGKYNILSPSEIIKSGMTTHDISPRMFVDYLKAQSGANIYVVGVQPQSISIGADMSQKVREAINEIKQLLLELAYA